MVVVNIESLFLGLFVSCWRNIDTATRLYIKGNLITRMSNLFQRNTHLESEEKRAENFIDDFPVNICVTRCHFTTFAIIFDKSF